MTSFTAANVLIDLEVLYFMYRGAPPLHRYLHTYVGGVATGLLAGVGTYMAAAAIARYVFPRGRRLELLRQVPRSQLICDSVAGGLLGGVSHILLDSCMHRDMHPMWPFAEGNELAGIISTGALHGALALAGFFGLILWLLLREP